jgi:hypothetical protein
MSCEWCPFLHVSRVAVIFDVLSCEVENLEQANKWGSIEKLRRDLDDVRCSGVKLNGSLMSGCMKGYDAEVVRELVKRAETRVGQANALDQQNSVKRNKLMRKWYLGE